MKSRKGLKINSSLAIIYLKSRRQFNRRMQNCRSVHESIYLAGSLLLSQAQLVIIFMDYEKGRTRHDDVKDGAKSTLKVGLIRNYTAKKLGPACP